MAKPVRDYDIIVSFRVELDGETRAAFQGYLPANAEEFFGLSYDCAAADGKGAFVVNEMHSGQCVHDEAEAQKAFERAKQEFGSKRRLRIEVWYSDDAGGGGDVALYEKE
jgi:hypothetical protein